MPRIICFNCGSKLEYAHNDTVIRCSACKSIRGHIGTHRTLREDLERAREEELEKQKRRKKNRENT